MAVRQADTLIEQAKQAQSSNDLVRARSLLSQVIKADPHNEEAWLLFAGVAEKKEHAIYCLEQVLKLNPVNMEALDLLNALKAPPAPSVTNPPTSQPVLVAPQPTPVQAAASSPPRAPQRETIILEERMHGAVFIVPPLIAIVGLAVGIFFGFLPGYGMGTIGFIAVVGFMLVALLELLRTTVRYATSRLTLTNKRIVIKRGLFNRQTFEILLKQVEGIGIKQPLVGRIFGFGTITVTGTGGAHQTFRGLRDPQEFREQVQAEIAAIQAKV
jgi:membrane protein YdbS with pleckstrin-like domain